MKIGVEGRTLQGMRHGVARYLSNLLRELLAQDTANDYLVYLSEPIEPLGYSAPNLSFSELHMRPSLAWRHLRLPLAMRSDRVDLHFSPSYFLPLYKVCPAVVVVHDISFRTHPEWFSGELRFRFDSIFWREVRQAERIITVSEFSRAEIARSLDLDPEGIAVIPEAADAGFRRLDDAGVAGEVRARLGLSEDFVFTVGAVHTRRNLERLIEALGMAARERGIEPQLLIVGAPASFSPPVDLEGAIRRAGLTGPGQVQHLPFVSEEDLLALYNACGLFVYPSLYEGFGLPVLEAMACGAPVACSSVSSIPEVAGDAAALFDPEDTREMAGVIGELLTDEAARNRLREMGPRRAATFSWERAARQTLELFNQFAR
jgi:glycosyltransferase involved in cell wall biosynthesis